MNLYPLFRYLLFRLDAETAHEFTLRTLAACSRAPSLLRLLFGKVPKCPKRVFGIDFPNPIGLAAGMDKNAVALRAWEALGFGFVEIGTITALPQPGNSKPRLFRYPEYGALVNRMGFNNEGCIAVAARLERGKARGRWISIPLGINIGKSKVTPLEEAPADYLASYKRLYNLGDYFVVNVSSPNTPGLRMLQGASELERILGKLRGWEGSRRKPLLVKLAPDLEDSALAEAAALCERCGADGIIATNTTLDHSALKGREDEAGGLSGAPLGARAAAALRVIRNATSLPVIASGGIMSGYDAKERFSAGACLVQIYTGFVYSGPGLLREILSAINVH
jgi:dihydroorotate dehydrogenase